VKNPYILDILV